MNADIHPSLDGFNTKDHKSNDNRKQQHKTGEIQIDEIKIDRLLHLLHEANPENPSQVMEKPSF